MNYELAKQLKEAGFPQRVGVNTMVWEGSLESWRVASDFEQGIELETVLVQPTLSELISTCMDIILAHNSDETWMKEDLWFFSLAPNINTSGLSTEIGKIHEWRASLDKGIDLDNIYSGANYFGDTPEEAVAKLWLELNK